MKPKRIIPCLDTTLDKQGNAAVFKGVRFESLRHAGDPLSLAKKYAEQGADEIVLLDITASIDKRPIIIDTVKAVASEIDIPLCVGGGIGSIEDFDMVLKSGANKVSVNTAAVKNPQLIKEAKKRFGDVVVAAIDCRRRHDNLKAKTIAEVENGRKAWYEVVTYGGRQTTGMDEIIWAGKLQELGACEILLTSKDKDGTKEGYDIPLTRAISASVSIPIVASGGVGNIEHMYEAFRFGGADACLAASIFHYDEYTIGQVKKYLSTKGIPMRI